MPGRHQPPSACLAMADSPPTAGRAGKLRLISNENTWAAARVIEAIRRSRPPEGWRLPRIREAGTPSRAIFTVPEIQLTNGPRTPYRSSSTPTLTARKPGDETGLRHVRFSRKWPAAHKEVEYPKPEWSSRCSLAGPITPENPAVLLSNPNNPTGTGVSLWCIERILHRARKTVCVRNLLRILRRDRAGRDRAPCPTCSSAARFRGFGMAAMRLGCLFSPAPTSRPAKRTRPTT